MYGLQGMGNKIEILPLMPVGKGKAENTVKAYFQVIKEYINFLKNRKKSHPRGGFLVCILGGRLP